MFPIANHYLVANVSGYVPSPFEDKPFVYPSLHVIDCDTCAHASVTYTSEGTVYAYGHIDFNTFRTDYRWDLVRKDVDTVIAYRAWCVLVASQSTEE